MRGYPSCKSHRTNLDKSPSSPPKSFALHLQYRSRRAKYSIWMKSASNASPMSKLPGTRQPRPPQCRVSASVMLNPKARSRNQNPWPRSAALTSTCPRLLGVALPKPLTYLIETAEAHLFCFLGIEFVPRMLSSLTVNIGFSKFGLMYTFFRMPSRCSRRQSAGVRPTRALKCLVK